MADEDARKIGEILDVVAARLPAVMGIVRETFLSESAGRDFGKAVGAFYKELVASGIDEKQALVLAEDYINTIEGAISQFQNQSGIGSSSWSWSVSPKAETGRKAEGGDE